jgi:hypothetical protein
MDLVDFPLCLLLFPSLLLLNDGLVNHLGLARRM